VTELELGINIFVIQPPPPVCLGTPKPILPPVDKLRMWLDRNGFTGEEGSDTVFFISPKFELGQEDQFCVVLITDHNVWLRGVYGYFQPKEFDFMCSYEHALRFVQRHFSK
jgi:hypothetical protein